MLIEIKWIKIIAKASRLCIVADNASIEVRFVLLLSHCCTSNSSNAIQLSSALSNADYITNRSAARYVRTITLAYNTVARMNYYTRRIRTFMEWREPWYYAVLKIRKRLKWFSAPVFACIRISIQIYSSWRSCDEFASRCDKEIKIRILGVISNRE